MTRSTLDSAAPARVGPVSPSSPDDSPPGAEPSRDAGTLLVLSVDTEEDGWMPRRDGATVENIREVPRFQAFLERLGVRPTYFTTYQVARQSRSAEIIRHMAAGGHAEVAAHLHPWNTPPLQDRIVPRETMLNNLPAAVQEAKLERLTDALVDLLGEQPTSFRAGRYGFGPELARALIRLGYRVDSSVTPLLDWKRFDEGPDFVDAPHHPYRLDAEGGSVVHPVPDGRLVELPVSCGFTRHPFGLWNPVHRFLDRPRLRALHAPGIAARLGMVRKVILSPEEDTAADMLLLARRLLERGERHLHLVVHSPSLRAGLSPFAPEKADVERLYRRIAEFVEGLDGITPIRPATVTEAAELLVP
jgi:hypothetical protein